MAAFKVVTREAEFAGRQITADIVRDDGKLIRSGMRPDCATIDCALLNECAAHSWTAEKYHAERRLRMASARA